ncbi:MAG TPA: hypothetical protein VJ603_03375 [Paucimonas sp.]|nr:hypothetical protein [Paucimonas sp.]HJW54667.1 hypothetical protein [Burkholderiaceae bacterium]
MRNVVHLNQKIARSAAAMMLATSLGCIAQTPPAEYGIKFEEPSTGTRIRGEAVRRSALPINRTYEQLSPEERAIVHGWYEGIAAGNEPPFPAEGTKAIHDAVRKGQAKLLVTGELFLVATVEATGEVSTVKAVGSPSPLMTKFAASVLLLTKFKPAVCGGQKCRMDFPLYYSFRVE